MLNWRSQLFYNQRAQCLSNELRTFFSFHHYLLLHSSLTVKRLLHIIYPRTETVPSRPISAIKISKIGLYSEKYHLYKNMSIPSCQRGQSSPPTLSLATLLWRLECFTATPLRHRWLRYNRNGGVNSPSCFYWPILN